MQISIARTAVPAGRDCALQATAEGKNLVQPPAVHAFGKGGSGAAALEALAGQARNVSPRPLRVAHEVFRPKRKIRKRPTVGCFLYCITFKKFANVTPFPREVPESP
jgi:hypothetical protein